MSLKHLKWLLSFALVLALFVVMLGAYTRLTHAGLGCPDWPGCYGKMVLPSKANALSLAQQTFPEIPIESEKAWTEMAHRYAAGSLALLIFILGITCIVKRKQQERLPVGLAISLMFLVIFQALLGMWTVTLKLLPVVVMAHLLGGILIFSCLARARLQLSIVPAHEASKLKPWLYVAFAVAFLQIALGGWVSANYAGIACIGFPQCNGFWWPQMHFSSGFNLFSEPGQNYQGGLLDSEVRASIQVIHRVGAVITLFTVLGVSLLTVLSTSRRSLKILSMVALCLVLTQFSLGILNVVYLLPLKVAVAHNGVAALLLATLFCMLYVASKRRMAGAG